MNGYNEPALFDAYPKNRGDVVLPALILCAACVAVGEKAGYLKPRTATTRTGGICQRCKAASYGMHRIVEKAAAA